MRLHSTVIPVALASLAAVGIAIAQNTQQPNAPQPQQANRQQQPNAQQPNGQQQPNAQGQSANEQQKAAILGAQIQAQGNQGLVATSVDQNGIWAHSGLRQNDRIISVHGQTINNPRQVEAFLWSQSGQQVPVVVERGGQRYTLQVAIPAHDDNSGWIGVNLDQRDADVTHDADAKGARVVQVYPSGPAARAGLQPGDVITSINDKAIDSTADAVLLIRELRPQAKANLVVMRGKEESKITVVVGSRTNSGYHQAFYGGPQGGGYDPRFAGQNQYQGKGPQGGNDQFHGNSATRHADGTYSTDGRAERTNRNRTGSTARRSEEAARNVGKEVILTHSSLKFRKGLP